MANIELIKTLRDRTGAGIMDCKNALAACGDDVEKACEWLREKGIAKAAKKASRIAAEGLTSVVVDGNKAVVLEVNCETDFVGKSDAFKELVTTVAKIVLEKNPANIEEAKTITNEIFVNATVKIGEKLDFRRFEVVTKNDNQAFGAYIHMGGKISVLALLDNATPELSKGIAMSIAANNPLYIHVEDIPADVVAHETEIQMESAKNDPKLQGKPQQALEKIIQGKVNKYLGESVLLAQEYILDPSQKVEAVLKANKASVVKFYRYQVGEGIQKRQDNFAEEVAAQMK